MKNYLLFNVVLLTTTVAIILLVLGLTENRNVSEISKYFSPSPTPKPKLTFTSIDTMKYSRDASREVMTDPKFDAIIDTQIKNIAGTKAKYVAISTPYDEEFIPVLKKWEGAARKYKLKVWFRGNFSGWENWFGYGRITRTTHLEKMEQFILKHPDIFEDGDIFTPCPECENGGPGDPRQTGDVKGFRSFMIEEYQTSQAAFKKIGKHVSSNMASMNYDVANLIMDIETTAAMGGLITVDHYVPDPERLVEDLEVIARRSKGKVVLGEYGAPIPDLHGDMTDEQQAEWIGKVLKRISQSYEVVGVNYWVNVGGSTPLWRDDGTPRPAVETIRNFYQQNLP